MTDKDKSAGWRVPKASPIRIGLRIGGRPPAASSLGDPLVARNLYYHGKQVTLDGYRFEECRFDHCTLVVHSANFVLDRCVIDTRSVIQYGPSLVKVIQLFTSRYDWLAENLPGLAPTTHADGTISIGTGA
jgi:hypothetical protein